MTKQEMTLRIASMPKGEFPRVVRMVRDGYGAHGITLETPCTLKQVNAVFQWTRLYPLTAEAVDAGDVVR